MHLFFICSFFILNQCRGSLSEKEQFLRFVPTASVQEQQSYYESPGLISPIEFDATWTQQVRVRIMDFLNNYPRLDIYCHVAPLDRDSELISAYLCKQTSPTATEQCIDPRSQTPQFREVKFNAIGNRSQGYTFHGELPAGRELLDAYYFCKFRNKRGELTSNMVEIQDVYYYQKLMVSRDVEPELKILPTINPTSLPLRLECGRPGIMEHTSPTWSDHSFPSPFRWSFCDLPNLSSVSRYNCINRVRDVPLRVSEYFENVIFPNGTLILLKRTAAAWKNMGLLCWSHIRPDAVFSVYFGHSGSDPGPIRYDPSVHYPSDEAIQVMSPTFQSVLVRKGPGGGIALVTSYQTNMDSVDFEWTKNGERIPLGFPQPTAFILTLPEEIKTNHSGLYQLNVRNGRSSVKFQFKVTVVGPPEVTVSPPSIVLAMERSEAVFECEIENSATTFLLINGEDYLPNSPSSEKKLIEQFPYLKDAMIHPLDIRGTHIQYRVSKLLFTAGSLFGPTHTVTIKALNSYGKAVVSTFVNILPRPRVIDSPAKYMCGPPCLSSSKHTFECKLDMTPYRLAHVKQTWDFNGTDVSTLSEQGDDRSEYLKDEGNRLVLQPVLDAQSVKLFANSHAACRLRIYYPAVLSEASGPSSSSSFIDPKWIVYDSRTDADIQPLLVTDVDLLPDYKPEQSSASISWYAAVIIAVIIFIIIGILITYLVMRGRGETYLLEKEERALGNDPERELLENEAFKVYERAEEPILHGSRCSLNDDSAEIGSDADGELDDYNLDPGKFNEEGSFIDQYATDSHYRGAPKLPTLPRPQNSHL